MGLFDAFKKKKDEAAAPEATEAVVPAETTEAVEAEPQEAEAAEEKKEPGIFGAIVKGGIKSALKAVGLAGWRAKQVEDLQPNFTSEDPLEHVLVLNKAGQAFGALKNLGIYADITKVTFSHALKVTTEDDFVAISTECREMAGQELPADRSSANPFDHAFDDLLSRECPDLSDDRKPDSVTPYCA